MHTPSTNKTQTHAYIHILWLWSDFKRVLIWCRAFTLHTWYTTPRYEDGPGGNIYKTFSFLTVIFWKNSKVRTPLLIKWVTESKDLLSRPEYLFLRDIILRYVYFLYLIALSSIACLLSLIVLLLFVSLFIAIFYIARLHLLRRGLPFISCITRCYVVSLLVIRYLFFLSFLYLGIQPVGFLIYLMCW